MSRPHNKRPPSFNRGLERLAASNPELRALVDQVEKLEELKARLDDIESRGGSAGVGLRGMQRSLQAAIANAVSSLGRNGGRS